MACNSEVSQGDDFSPKSYLRSYVDPQDKKPEVSSWLPQLLRSLHECFSRVGGALSADSASSLRLLELGSGPCLHGIISASRYFDQIVLSDFSPANRKELQLWIDKSRLAHDWSRFFRFVSRLEGSSDIRQPELRIRQAMLGVVSCDVTSDALIETDNPTIPPVFDCISTCFCLRIGCPDLLTFERTLRTIASKLCRGGYVVIIDTLRKDSSSDGVKPYTALYLTEPDVESAVQNAGFGDVTMEVNRYMPGRPERGHNYKYDIFSLTARKL